MKAKFSGEASLVKTEAPYSGIGTIAGGSE